jgi:hypothetical protein
MFSGPQPQRVRVSELRVEMWHLPGGGTHQRPSGSHLPGEGHRIASAWVFLGQLVLGEGPRGHEILYHATVLELVLNRVHVVRAVLLEESLEVVHQRPRLMLATTRVCLWSSEKFQ